MTEYHELGDVWRVDFHSKKPWAVQGPGAVSRFRQKKQAVAISELFKRERDRQNEFARAVNR